ncbi:hypothetical protein FACS1894110_16560 [Spirochaetia bacterium]|nr:hypothetical protein FACS1894110_16560 [Spirochaetia bacterium]
MKAETENVSAAENIKREIQNLETQKKQHEIDAADYYKNEQYGAFKEMNSQSNLCQNRIAMLKRRLVDLNIQNNTPELKRRLKVIHDAGQEAVGIAASEFKTVIKSLSNIEAARAKYNLTAECIGGFFVYDIPGHINHTGRTIAELIQDFQETADQELPTFADRITQSSKYYYQDQLERGGYLLAERTPEQLKADKAAALKLEKELNEKKEAERREYLKSLVQE